TRDHDAAVGVEQDAAHAATLRDDDVDGAVGCAPVHTALRDVAEVEATIRAGPRPFHQAVPARQRLDHCASVPDAGRPAAIATSRPKVRIAGNQPTHARAVG